MNPFEIVINGWPIIPIILGLVEFVKRLGLKWNVLIIVSMALGFLLGGGYYWSQKPPTTFADWFAIVIGSLGYGLVASGVYDVITKPKAA